MEVQLFCVFDAVLGKYNEPFHARTVDRAKFMFQQVVNSPDTDFYKFPAEYTLFHVGSFNLETGLPTALNTPHSLGVAQEYLITPEESTDG
jgi:hypothetical protein